MYMLPIEIMDGFSEAYGASWSDVVANAAGAALSGAQLLAWHQIRIHPKFSFRRTPLASLRPHLLGSTPVQEALATRPDLSRVVVQLTGHTPADDLDCCKPH